MKRMIKSIVVLVMSVALVASCVISSVAASKTDIVTTAKECIPSAYTNLYINTLESALSRINVTSEQADQVIEVLKSVRAQIPEDKGHTLHDYTPAERTIMINGFKKCCSILGLSYYVSVKSSDKADHTADEVIYIYASDGNWIVTVDGDSGLVDANGNPTNATITDKTTGQHLVAVVDGDIVKKTDVDSDLSTQMILLIAAVAALALAGCAFAVCKKLANNSDGE